MNFDVIFCFVDANVIFSLAIGSRIAKTHDFGYVALDMTHVRGDDDGVYMCRASNPLGEAVTTASMKVKSKCLNYFNLIHFLFVFIIC